VFGYLRQLSFDLKQDRYCVSVKSFCVRLLLVLVISF